MVSVFEGIKKGQYVKVKKSKDGGQSSSSVISNLSTAKKCGSFAYGEVIDLQTLPKVAATKTDGNIVLENLSVITPNGDVVIPGLSLNVSTQFEETFAGKGFCFLTLSS